MTASVSGTGGPRGEAGEACDTGISTARGRGAAAGSPTLTAGTAKPPPSSVAAPPGMVWVPGGEFGQGSDEEMFQDARPIHHVGVDGFWMDATEVTNESSAFVEATST